jgi:hypothetical protein
MKFLTFNEKFIFLFLLLVYSVTLILMPFELDESLHILTGEMILKERLNPLMISYNNLFIWMFEPPTSISNISGFFLCLYFLDFSSNL